MPPVVAVVGGALGLTGIAAVVATVVVVAVAAVVITKIFSSMGGGRSLDDRGLRVNKTGNNHYIPVIYGTHQVAMTRIERDSGTETGDPSGTEYLHEIHAVCEGEIENFECVWFGDEPVWKTCPGTNINSVYNRIVGIEQGEYHSNNNLIVEGWKGSTDPKIATNSSEDGTVVVNMDQMSGIANNSVRDTTHASFPYGVYMDTANATSGGEKGAIYIAPGQSGPAVVAGHTFLRTHDEIMPAHPDWNSYDRGAGVAWLYFRLKRNQDLYSGPVQTITTLVKGRRVKNLLTGNVEYSENPADCIYDYIVNTRFGPEFPEHKINMASFLHARAFYETAQDTVTINEFDTLGNVIGSTTTTVNPYRFNGAALTDSTCWENVKELAGNVFSNVAHIEGEVYLLPTDSKNFNDVFDFNDSNIVGEKTIKLPDADTLRNKVEARYYDKEFKYDIMTQVVQDDALIAADDNVILQQNVEFSMCDNRAAAYSMARQLLDQSRHKTSITFQTTMAAIQLHPYDPVTVTLEDYGWDKKQFIVISIIAKGSKLFVSLEEYREPIIK